MNCLVLIIICTKDLSTQNAQVETDYHYNFNIWNEHIYSKGDNNRFTISTWMLLSALKESVKVKFSAEQLSTFQNKN